MNQLPRLFYLIEAATEKKKKWFLAPFYTNDGKNFRSLNDLTVWLGLQIQKSDGLFECSCFSRNCLILWPKNFLSPSSSGFAVFENIYNSNQFIIKKVLRAFLSHKLNQLHDHCDQMAFLERKLSKNLEANIFCEEFALFFVILGIFVGIFC